MYESERRAKKKRTLVVSHVFSYVYFQTSGKTSVAPLIGAFMFAPLKLKKNWEGPESKSHLGL